LHAFQGTHRIVELPQKEILGKGVAEVAARTNAGKTKTGIKLMLERDGGVYLNNQATRDWKQIICEEDLVDGCVLVFRFGKKDYHVIKVTSLNSK